MYGIRYLEALAFLKNCGHMSIMTTSWVYTILLSIHILLIVFKFGGKLTKVTLIVIYFAEDMRKDDHELKLKVRAQMKAAHDAGRRVCFRRGKLIIDSWVTAIEGANGSGGSVHENVDVV